MFFGEIFNVIFILYIGNQPIQQFQISGPRPMIEAQFLSLTQQIAEQKGKQPMSVIMQREEIIFDPFENHQKAIPYTLEFYNYEREET